MLTRFKNLRLRFIEGEGEGGGGEGEQVESTEQPVADQQAQPNAGNPAWEGIRSQLDPLSFSKIEPELAKWDKGVQDRLSKSTAPFEPFKQFIEGRQPEFIQQAITYAEQLDADPQKVYEMLGKYLKDTGRLPNAQELQTAADAGELDSEGEDQQQPVTDPRVDQILGLLQQQAQAEVQRAAESDLTNTLKSFRDSHKDLSDDDEKEIIRRAAFVAQQNPKAPIDYGKSLESAFNEFSALKNRILSTSRPGDSAPTLLPLSGGTPGAAPQKSPGQWTRGETQDTIAALIEANRGN